MQQKILLLEPFFSGSHQAWAQGYQQHSRHQIELLTLKGRHWKWRMHGGAVTLARRFKESKQEYDRILATSMLDLTTFLALTRPQTSDIPVDFYFHENQLTYPWSAEDPDVKGRQDRHYGFLNYTSALAADRLFFNSAFHRDSFLAALEAYLKVLPDHREMASVKVIADKSKVLPLGMDLQRFDAHRDGVGEPNEIPIIVWNHRWEYDKNPESFFQLLFRLVEEGNAFQVVVLGENYRKSPPIFEEARMRLGDRILHFGFAKDFATYAYWLWRSDIAITSSRQDFFGGSVVEAIYCDCWPILPNRLAYPEHLPGDLKGDCLYESEEDLYKKVMGLLVDGKFRERPLGLREQVERYDWGFLVGVYDGLF